MPAVFITSTPRGSLEALAYQGILVTDCYHQIKSALDRTLSPEHALLFAEPVHDESRREVDWYTEASGPVCPLTSKPPEEQNQIRSRIKAIASDIIREAETLRQNMDGQKAARGNILALALKYPGDEHIYMVGSQPVLTCWGFAPGTQGAQPQELTRLGMAAALPVAAPEALVAAEPAKAEVVPVAERSPRSWSWLWTLLKTLLILLMLYFLAALLFGPSGCVHGGVTLPGFSGCSRAPASMPDPVVELPPALSSELDMERAKEAKLRTELDALRQQLLELQALCVPPKEEEPKPDPRVEEPPALADLMPRTEETPPPPEPKPEPKPQPPRQQPPQPPKDNKLHIPEQTKRNRDYEFLEGCWIAETGLFNRRTGKPIVAEYCFDADGRGTRRVTEQDGSQCVGPVRARFGGELLFMDADSATCPNKGLYVPHRVECRDGGTEAQCHGQELGGSHTKWNAKFRRK